MVVLGLACEEPMHPYRMQTLIKQRGKDQIANVAQRNSVYQTIDALRRAGLIAVRETSRDERRPERSIYEATDLGRHALRSWVRAGLSTPAREFPEFPAVLSALYGVRGAEDLREMLETRVTALEARLADLEKVPTGIPRLLLLEGAYMAALVHAEIQWLRRVIVDLRFGRLTFPSIEEVAQIGVQMGGPGEKAVRRIAAEIAGAPARAPKAASGDVAFGRRSAKMAPRKRLPKRRATARPSPGRGKRGR
jgi:DNA-binding PadR family transcriptional regulator